jgi:hypothetical protein
MAGPEFLKIRIYTPRAAEEAALKPYAAPPEGAFHFGTELHMSDIENWFVCSVSHFVSQRFNHT